jgi:hypothetical protein
MPLAASQGGVTRRPDFWSGLFFLVVGGAACVYAMLSYRIGTPARMGPGFFPALVGGLIALIGAVILVLDIKAARAAAADTGQSEFGLVPLATTIGSVVAFALLLKPFGLIVSVAAMVMIARIARPGAWREIIALSTIICLIAFLIFSVGLRMPFKVVPW